jgi:hypothetical protein
MVKSSQPRPGAFPRGPRPDINADGSPRKRPGKTAKPDLVKTGRLITRMHPDLMEVIDLRAAERGMTRSRMIEQVMIGFLASDPRNPKMTAIGKIDRTAPTPLEAREANPHRYAERWQRFTTACQAIFNAPPHPDWVDDEQSFWSPYSGDDGPVPEDPHAAGDAERAEKWARTKKS